MKAAVEGHTDIAIALDASGTSAGISHKRRALTLAYNQAIGLVGQQYSSGDYSPSLTDEVRRGFMHVCMHITQVSVTILARRKTSSTSMGRDNSASVQQQRLLQGTPIALQTIQPQRLGSSYIHQSYHHNNHDYYHNNNNNTPNHPIITETSRTATPAVRIKRRQQR